MNAVTPIKADTLAIWNALGKTDPAHTKQFKRSGGFSGTALKPIWVDKRITEQFGPVGIGWGVGEPRFQIVPGENKEVLVYCWVECWHTEPSNTFWGVGGDKIVTYIKANAQYNRPERWENDDEAFKKAFTDAKGNAFKLTGVGADIHMGQFDDSKYVREVAREFAAQEAEREQSQGDSQGKVSPARPKGWREDGSPYSTPSALHKACTGFERELMGCGDTDMVYGLTATPDWIEFVRVCEKHSPHYLRGGEPAPPEFEGLLNIAERLVREFDSATANNMAALGRT